MISNTLMIVGPGGIGKSPLDKIVRNDAIRIDPYRLRPDGPRPPKNDEKDLFYAHPKLRDELYLTFQSLGVGLTCLSQNVQWFPEAMAVFLRVRTEWQLLLLEGLDGEIGKAEIYAPAVPILLDNPQIRRVFGRLSIVVLNPADKLELEKEQEFANLKKITKKNCELRGDEPDSVNKRANSIDEEGPVWLWMIESGATEYPNWPFPEYVYKNGDEKE